MEKNVGRLCTKQFNRLLGKGKNRKMEGGEKKTENIHYRLTAQRNKA